MKHILPDEFTTIQIQPTDKVPTPPYPRVRGNVLTCLNSGEWKFEGVNIYPSGKLTHWEMLLPPGSQVQTMMLLHSADFWTNWWETMVITMQGAGEGTDGKPVARH